MKRRPQRRDQPLGVSKRPKAHNTPSEPGYGPATSQTESRLANIDEFDFITQSDQSRADSSLNVSIDDLTMPEQEDRYREWRSKLANSSIESITDETRVRFDQRRVVFYMSCRRRCVILPYLSTIISSKMLTSKQ